MSKIVPRNRKCHADPKTLPLRKNRIEPRAMALPCSFFVIGTRFSRYCTSIATFIAVQVQFPRRQDEDLFPLFRGRTQRPILDSLGLSIEGIRGSKLGLSDKPWAVGGAQNAPGENQHTDSKRGVGRVPNSGPQRIDSNGAGSLVRGDLEIAPIPVRGSDSTIQFKVCGQCKDQYRGEEASIPAGNISPEVDPLREEMKKRDADAAELEQIKSLPKQKPGPARVHIPQKPADRHGGKQRGDAYHVENRTAEPDCSIHQPDEAQKRDHRATLSGNNASAKSRFWEDLELSTHPFLERQPTLSYGFPTLITPRCMPTKPSHICSRIPTWICVWMLTALSWTSPAWGQAPASGNTDRGVEIVAIEGKVEEVEISRSGATDWDRAYVGQKLRPGDRGRTGPDNRLTLRLSDLSVMRVAERSEFTVHEPPKPDHTYGLSLWRGLVYLFHRDKPGSTEIDAHGSVAATRGTEFTVSVDPETQRMQLTVLAGAGELSNALGTLQVQAGEQGESDPRTPPRPSPKLEAQNGIQWVLYYPGILFPPELPWTSEETHRLGASFRAYQSGNISEAFATWNANAGKTSASPSESLFQTALRLAIGQVDTAKALLRSVQESPQSSRVHHQIGDALQSVLTALQESESGKLPEKAKSPAPLATERLAASYVRQAHRQLPEALEAAKEAVQIQPEFGFGWVRIAELEFGFGRIAEAEKALIRARALSPSNAQASALAGFLAASRYRFALARQEFELALKLDPALGNAWLGRGLLRIRQGDTEGGRQDLQMAASLEPQRGVLRSYLGKAWQENRDPEHAREELRLAKALDPQDPTAWLYSALLNQQYNAFNQAIRDFETSQALNQNRSVYRSTLLLDQDRAVRGANLAGSFRDAGLGDLGLTEASRAVSSDYLNFSAHLFLANTYDQLRDPHQINIRYEAPWLSEYLMANLLAPASAGALSQQVSQQEYSRFFERDGFGLSTSTAYQSRGDWQQSAAQYGRFANMSYALEGSYRWDRGQRPNEDFTSRWVDFQFKQEFTAQDSFYLQAIDYSSDGGDLAPYYNASQSFPRLRVHEKQDPLLLLGYHREWEPGVHTLFLGGRLQDQYRAQNPDFPSYAITLNGFGQPVALPVQVAQDYQSQYEVYSAEVQHILQKSDHTWIVGARGQTGDFNARNDFTSDATVSGLFTFPVTPSKTVSGNFSRFTAYLYDQWQLSSSWLAIGGLTYDHLRYPVNYRFAPLAAGEASADQWSPKFGLVWTPTSRTTVRGAISRSLGGVAFDQSFQLEPSQIAGFNQVFRSLIPEAVANANSAAEFRMGTLALEHRVTSNTWVGISGEWFTSDVDRATGAFDFANPLTPRLVQERIEYQERALSAYVYHLIDQSWSLGAKYRVSDGNIDLHHRSLPDSAFQPPDFGSTSTSAVLHQGQLFAQFQHPSGFFGKTEGLWRHQVNRHYSPSLAGEDFWQMNLYAGYRWPNRRAEILVGLLNVFNQDYHLNPLNVTELLPRTRTIAVSLKLNF